MRSAGSCAAARSSGGFLIEPETVRHGVPTMNL